MAGLKRCTVPHWQGNDFVAIGTVLPDGHPGVIDVYFEDLDIETVSAAEPAPAVEEPASDVEAASDEPVKRGPGRPKKTSG